LAASEAFPPRCRALLRSAPTPPLEECPLPARRQSARPCEEMAIRHGSIGAASAPAHQ